MAAINCRHCNGVMSSESRRSQCPHCGALFPFVCAVGGRNLRPPFPVFDDERHLTFTSAEIKSKKIELSERAEGFIEKEPLPLSDEHHLRECPDCHVWFLASENPSNFRCPTCAAKWQQNRFTNRYEEEEEELEDAEQLEHSQSVVMTQTKAGFDANVLVILAGAVAFIGLLTWFLMKPA
jgi:Zn finger protein HypA/HybF involved in hydrogenase expression